MKVTINGRQYSPAQAVQLAKSLWQQNQLRQARQVYESIEHMLSNNETVNAQFFPLYIHLKDFKKAEELLRKELKLAPKNPSTNANLALTLQQQGRYKQAIRHYDIALKAQPNDAAIWNNLGTAHQSAQTKIKAKFAFNKAVSLAPNNAKYQANYAIALMELEAFTEAEAVLKRAVQQDHRDPLVHSAIKRYFTATSSTQDPEELSYLFVLAELPEISDFHADFARYYEKRNRLEESRKIICDGLQITPGDTFLSVLLAQNARRLKQYDKAQELLANTTVKGLNDEQQQLFHFESARLFDSIGQYDKAFENFTSANDLSRKIWKQIRDAGQGEGRMDADTLSQFYKTSWLAEWHSANPSDDTAEPVFLIGFPRSGTTLLERVLNAHPALSTISEKDTVQTVLNMLTKDGLRYPQGLKDITQDYAQKLRKAYFKKAYEYADKQKVVVDKMPLNTLHVGLLYQLFPNAKFVFSQRHPYDVCLSNFMQDFKLNGTMIHFTNLLDTAEFYDQVFSLWAQYQQNLPLRVHTIKYERMVEDFDQEVGALLAFIGVEWDTQVKQFYSTEKGAEYVDTPSYHQVSQPLYSELEYRWKHYPDAIAVLKPRIEKYVNQFGY